MEYQMGVTNSIHVDVIMSSVWGNMPICMFSVHVLHLLAIQYVNMVMIMGQQTFRLANNIVDGL